MGESAPLSRYGIFGACQAYRAEMAGGEFLRETAERYKVEHGVVGRIGCLGN